MTRDSRRRSLHRAGEDGVVGADVQDAVSISGVRNTAIFALIHAARQLVAKRVV